MKNSVYVSLPVLVMLLSLAGLASANTSINISNNASGASSDVSVKSNTGKSTVCINGKCTTSEHGDIHVQSDDGKTKVMIQNNTKQSTHAAVKQSSPEAKPAIATDNFMLFLQAKLKSLQDLLQNMFN